MSHALAMPERRYDVWRTGDFGTGVCLPCGTWCEVLAFIQSQQWRSPTLGEYHVTPAGTMPC